MLSPPDDVDSNIFAEVYESIPLAALVIRVQANANVGGKAEPIRYTLLAANRSARHATRLDLANMLGSDMADAMPGFLDSGLGDHYRAALATGHMTEIGELRFLGAPDEEAIYRVRAYPVARDCVLVTYENVTELSRAQSQLIQSGKLAAIGELSGAMAHEINNTLMAIMASAEFLGEDLDRGQLLDHRTDISTILEAAHRGSEVTRQLLSFARNASAKMDTINLRDVVDSTFALLGGQLDKLCDARLEIHCEDQLPIEGNANQLQQVLTNLALNAAHAVGRGRRQNGQYIEVRAHSHEGWIILSVRDTGCGVAPEIRERIFEAFFTSKPPGQGTGLGLSVSRNIIENHGGRLELETEAGVGSTFRVILPRLEHP